MLRVPQLARRLQAAAAASARTQATASAPPAAAASAALVPSIKFNEVKFQKEDVEKVMTELPSFSFYEMSEDKEPNPYSMSTMDHSIILDPQKPALSPPKMEFSKLENGLKIASIDKQGMKASLGLYVSAGSRYETSANFGVSHMVSLMGFTSTAHLSHLRTVKTLEQLGAAGTSECLAGREEIVYKVELMREFVPFAVPLMIGNVLFPRLLPWEVKAASKKLREARAAVEGDPDAMINELLHKAAYCNNSLGFAPSCTERCLPYFTPDTIRSFMMDHFAPERMALVGVNVGHSELSKWAMRSFADYNAIPLKKREAAKAQYTGGDLRMEGASPYCHLAIALESEPWGKRELAPVTLLQAMLGSASAVAGEIGSGRTSRLATEIVKQSPHVESCAAFNTSYSDSGLFGIYGVSQPDKAGAMAAAMLKSLAGLTSVGKGELDRAKAMLKGKIYRQTDDGSALMQDMGQQLLLSGSYGSPADFAKAIEGVSETQVTAAAKKLLSSRPTVAAFGDTHTVPHYSAVEAALRA